MFWVFRKNNIEGEREIKNFKEKRKTWSSDLSKESKLACYSRKNRENKDEKNTEHRDPQAFSLFLKTFFLIYYLYSKFSIFLLCSWPKLHVFGLIWKICLCGNPISQLYPNNEALFCLYVYIQWLLKIVCIFPLK